MLFNFDLNDNFDMIQISNYPRILIVKYLKQKKNIVKTQFIFSSHLIQLRFIISHNCGVYHYTIGFHFRLLFHVFFLLSQLNKLGGY